MQRFDSERYRELARARREAYANARPFPHVVIDDFLDAAAAERAAAEFPDPGSVAWDRSSDVRASSSGRPGSAT